VKVLPLDLGGLCNNFLLLGPASSGAILLDASLD
jgi:hypothetical protein